MPAVILAITCTRSIVRQPGFWVLLLAGAGVCYLSQYFVLFGFGQTEGMLREIGLANVTLVGIISVLLFGTGGMEQDSVAHREFFLSKPISPAQYLVGKYLGLLAAVWVAAGIILGVVCCLLLFRRTGPLDTVIAGAFLGFIQIGILAAFAVSLSLFLSIFMNVSVLLGIYVAGHLASHARPAGTTGHLLYALIPNLENFNAGMAVARGIEVPFHLLALDAAYGVVYTLLVLVAAVALSSRWQTDPR